MDKVCVSKRLAKEVRKRENCKAIVKMERKKAAPERWSGLLGRTYKFKALTNVDESFTDWPSSGPCTGAAYDPRHRPCSASGEAC
jgi:hypothetical protein